MNPPKAATCSGGPPIFACLRRPLAAKTRRCPAEGEIEQRAAALLDQKFSIADRADPRQVAFVDTDCGSHTHTLVPDEANKRVLIYVLSYPLGGQSASDCNPETHTKISAVEFNTVPLVTERDVLVSGWYNGGVTVVAFSDPSHPRQLGHYTAKETDVATSGRATGTAASSTPTTSTRRSTPRTQTAPAAGSGRRQ